MKDFDTISVPSEFFAQADIPVFLLSQDKSFTFGNEVFYKKLGTTKEDFEQNIHGCQEDFFQSVERFFSHDDHCFRAQNGVLYKLVIHDSSCEYIGCLQEVDERHIIHEKIHEVFQTLSQTQTLPKRCEELIQLFMDTYGKLLPGRLLCLRFIEQNSGQLLHVMANGQLSEDQREQVVLSSDSLKRYVKPETIEKIQHLQFSEKYIPIFKNSVGGFDVPFVDGTSIYGVLSVEYPDSVKNIEKDIDVVGVISPYFTILIRYIRLLGESMHFRDYLVKLLDNANAPILVTDRNRRIKIINQAFEQLTGYSREEVLDKDVMKFLPQGERDRFLPAVINALRGRSTGSIEIRIPHRGGSGKAQIALSTAAVKSGFGEIEGVVAIGQDLTELRRLQKQILHSEKLATIGQLSAGVVHELNNPLTSISVYSEYLLKKFENADGDTGDIMRLRRICEGADRILKFTRDLVAYARPAGEEPRLIDLKEVVESALVFCEHVIEKTGVCVDTAFEIELPKIYGIKGQLQQVLVNLITNACDSMSDAKGRLGIELRSADELVTLLVSDSGPGVPENEREQIFEPFYTTKPEGKGTGLGLSIVKNIITNHNGNITVREANGRGATFVIELFAAT